MRILLVENDVQLVRQLTRALKEADYSVDLAADGEEGLFLGETEPYDAVILDLGLPRLSGLTILRHWRQANLSVPVLILTVRDTWSEKVAGFDAGADDYMTKPFHIEELLARLRALIRRAAGQASPVIECGSIRLDTRSGHVAVSGIPVTLTANERQVLSYLIHHQGRVISRSELVEHIYDGDFDRDSNTIEVFIARLRKKIGPNPIETKRGQGYCLAVPGNVS
jgi:two-component system, OmpR family, response regulator